MNQAHLHLVFNHFPLIGTIFGLGILIFGLFKNSQTLKETGLVLLVISALLVFPTMKTGEGAEEIVEGIGISKTIIHEHEELAEKFFWLIIITGISAILSFVALRKKLAFVKIILIITTLLAIASIVLGKFVGTTGGEIRHTEIRNNIAQPVQNQLNNSDDDN